MNSHIEQIQDNTNHLVTFLENLDLSNEKPTKDQEWSILEILEHIYITDRGIYKMLSKPTDLIAESDEIAGKGKLEHILINKRANKVKSPDSFVPKGIYKDVDSFKKEFLAFRNAMVDDIINERFLIDQRIHKHFVLGEMTISDWIYFIIYHTNRHLEQIKERI
ncbi:DinB family protein [Flammeovirga sp. SubArs3]|uniref:DinB family protein n=1 Tax=Flammeovirga sp. SubArs3 TaxID=2995316 RepID=UPI00248AAC09|nr:DinB family protein [Flammeovirga sp. SubArs3]